MQAIERPIKILITSKPEIQGLRGGEICWGACLLPYQVCTGLCTCWVVDGELHATIYYDCVLMVVQLQVLWYLPLLLNRMEDNLPVRERW